MSAPLPRDTPAQEVREAARLATQAGPIRRRALRIALQISGFVLGVGLLTWCGWTVFNKPQSRDQLARLFEAPWDQLAGLLVLSGATITLSGLVFWAVIRPTKRMSALDAVAVNSVCSALSYLPFKMSLLFRVVHHHRRDRMPLFSIGGWLAACAVVILFSLAPPVAMSAWRKQVDAVWWAGSVGGVMILGVAMVAGGRWASGPQGRSMIDRAAAATRLGPLRRFVAGESFARLLQGAAMLGHWRAVTGSLVLRSADITTQALRFALAAKIIGVALTADQAIVAGAAYFLLQLTAPTGVAGVREAGTTGVLSILGLGQEVLVVVLAVSAGEAVMNLLMGAVGAAWLRVDRLLSGPPAIPSGDAAGSGPDQPDHR